MANNPYVNKVVFGNMTLIDTSNVTVTPDKLAEGYTALDASGALITGTYSGGASGTITVDLGLTEGSFYYLALPYGVTAAYYNRGMQGAGMFDDGYIFTTSYYTSFSVLVNSSFTGFEIRKGALSCNVTNSGIIAIGSGVTARRVKVFTITLTNEDIALTYLG